MGWRRRGLHSASEWSQTVGARGGRSTRHASQTKIICVHLNYESRRIEFGAPPIVTPTYFQKPPTTLNAHRGKLNRPADCQYLNYEGRGCAQLWVSHAKHRVRMMCGIASLDSPRLTMWARMIFAMLTQGLCCASKVRMDFALSDQGLVRGVDIRESTLRTYINGQVVQEDPVSAMAFGIDYQLADLARHITLLPGDIVLTGTPANSRQRCNRVTS